MRKVIIVLSCVFTFAFSSCNKNTVYNEYENGFTDNRWMKTEVLSYEFTIETAGPYEISIDFSHVYDTPLSEVPLNLVLELPNKEIVDEDVSILLRDGEGQQIGDCTGDYCDLRQVVLKRNLEPGFYKAQLRHKFNFDYLPNILGIGLRVARPDQ